VRLTSLKLLAVTPSSSLVEMNAEKDLLRAEFAMTVHRFGTRLAAMHVKEASLSAEIGKKAAEISHLKIALNESSSAILAYQAREQLRRSVVRRTIKLLSWMFDRPYRRSERLALREGLEHVAAPPLQNLSIDPAFQDEPAPSVTERLLAPPQLTLGLRRDFSCAGVASALSKAARPGPTQQSGQSAADIAPLSQSTRQPSNRTMES
jgi:hypothetical protein